MYLDWRGEWRLPPLNGIASAPLLQDDGAIKSAEGYDSASGMWCESVPNLTALVPDRPTKADAVSALRLIRETFKTFCFADAETIDRVRKMNAICHRFKVPLAAAALQFSMCDPRITSTIIGLSRAERLAQTVELAHTPIPNEVWPLLDAVGYTMDDPEASRWK